MSRQNFDSFLVDVGYKGVDGPGGNRVYAATAANLVTYYSSKRKEIDDDRLLIQDMIEQFGQNPKTLLDSVNQFGPPVNPREPKINLSSRYGIRWENNRTTSDRHDGIDIGTGKRTGVYCYAVMDGVVESAKKEGSYGNMLRLKSQKPVDGKNHLYANYAHLERFLVPEGASVHRGQPIGIIGRSGGNYAIHLHFELAVGNSNAKTHGVNPLRYPKMKNALAKIPDAGSMSNMIRELNSAADADMRGRL